MRSFGSASTGAARHAPRSFPRSLSSHAQLPGRHRPLICPLSSPSTTIMAGQESTTRQYLWTPARGISFMPALSTASTPRLDKPPPQAAPCSHPGSIQPTRKSAHTVASSHQDTLMDSDWGAHFQTDDMASPVADEEPALESEETDVIDNDVDPADNPVEPEAARQHPPYPALDYQIVDELFYAAKQQLPGSPGSFWSHTMYRGPSDTDAPGEKVKIHYCKNKQAMERVCAEHFLHEKVLGFDLEWSADARAGSSIKKNVSLIQVASPSRIGLFHVALFPGTAKKTDVENFVAPSFRKIMEDPTITKAGVNIKGDATRLRRVLNIDTKGLMELSHIYKQVTSAVTGGYEKMNKKVVSMAIQVEQFLHLPLFKGSDVRSSDWSRDLNMDQVKYSAADAYAGLQLYATLEHHRENLDPCPPRPWHAELDRPIPLPPGVHLKPQSKSLDDDKADVVRRFLEEQMSKPDDVDPSAAKPAPTTAPKPKQTLVKAAPAPKHPTVESAEDRAKSYRQSHPASKTSASFPQLRAYYLWHNHLLTPGEIASLLRDPPLAINTVVGYILTALHLENGRGKQFQSANLPYNEDRLRDELVAALPEGGERRFPLAARVRRAAAAAAKVSPV